MIQPGDKVVKPGTDKGIGLVTKRKHNIAWVQWTHVVYPKREFVFALIKQ